MEVKVVSSAGRTNRIIIKDRYNKVHKSLSRKRAHNGIDESMMYGISKMMNHLIPKGRHYDDVNLLEFTVEYLKQTADFRRGAGFCAEETKLFLTQHIFDRRKMNILFREIEQRIGCIEQQRSTDSIDCVQRETAFNTNHIESLDKSSTGGVLLDLSMKQNRLRDATSFGCNSTTIHSVCNTLKKREILDKIRKKILDKRRRLSDTAANVKVVQNEMMWRPWRY